MEPRALAGGRHGGLHVPLTCVGRFSGALLGSCARQLADDCSLSCGPRTVLEYARLLNRDEKDLHSMDYL